MSISLRQATLDDVAPCSELVVRAFQTVARRHNFSPDFSSVHEAAWVVSFEVSHGDKIYGVVAETDVGENSNNQDKNQDQNAVTYATTATTTTNRTKKIVGCAFINFLDAPLAGVDLVAVDPDHQGQRIGRRLMEQIIAKAKDVGTTSIRLVQDTYNMASFKLYSSVGFYPVEMLTVFMLKPEREGSGGGGGGNKALKRYEAAALIRTEDGDDEQSGPRRIYSTSRGEEVMLRKMTLSDIDECDAMFQEVHDYSRSNDMVAMLSPFATVVPHVLVSRSTGKIVAYSTGISYEGHTLAKHEEDARLLIANYDLLNGESDKLKLFLPSQQYPSLLWWCINDVDLLPYKNSALMVLGKYTDPKQKTSGNSVYIPSVVY